MPGTLDAESRYWQEGGLVNNKLGTGFTIFLGACVVIALASLGAISLNWPWSNLDVATNEVSVMPDAPATVYKIEPIALDCRARVHAEIPVSAKKDHRLLGQTYRTDKVDMTAYGDVDTCVDASQVEVLELADGGFIVRVPASAIEFVRPRVDAIATQRSVSFSKGFVGKLTDAFPWVSDNEGLTPAAYSFSQVVIGGSDCMRAAYDVTRELLIDAYTTQIVEQGGDADQVEVEIIGEPDFDQNEGAALGDFDFEVVNGEISCELAPDATTLPDTPTPEPELRPEDFPAGNL